MIYSRPCLQAVAGGRRWKPECGWNQTPAEESTPRRAETVAQSRAVKEDGTCVLRTNRGQRISVVTEIFS